MMIGELAALGAALSWTVSALLYRKALLETRPISANIIRLTCTGLVLLVFLVVFGKSGILMSLPVDVVALAVTSGIVGLGVGDTLYMESLKRIGVARAVPISCTYPLFSLLLAIFLVGEQVTLMTAVGAIIIVVGIWLLSEKDKEETREGSITKGVILALVTAVVWSLSITMINVALKTNPDLDHALAINTIRVLAVAVSLFALSPIIDRGLKFRKVRRKDVIALVAGGLVALGLGWFFLTYSFIEIPESQAVPISSTTPLFSTLAGIALLHERVTKRNMIGSAIIVAGIFLVFLM